MTRLAILEKSAIPDGTEAEVSLPKAWLGCKRATMKLFALILLAAPLSLSGQEALSAEDVHFFTDKVQPLLEQRCFECHSHQSKKMKNGLALDSRSGWAKGGDA